MRRAGEPPLLVAVGTGGEDDRCRRSLDVLLANVERAMPDVTVVPAWLAPGAGAVESVMASLTRSAVVVPLVAASSAPVLDRLTRCAALAGPPVLLAPPAGPHRLLARASVAMLRKVGAGWGDAVVLAAPGQDGDSSALRDSEQSARLLASEWGPNVSVACESPDGGLPSVRTAVEEWRELGQERVFVVPNVVTYAEWLPAIRAAALSAGASAVTAEVAGHGLATELVVSRYQHAGAKRRRLVRAA